MNYEQYLEAYEEIEASDASESGKARLISLLNCARPE